MTKKSKQKKILVKMYASSKNGNKMVRLGLFNVEILISKSLIVIITVFSMFHCTFFFIYNQLFSHRWFQVLLSKTNNLIFNNHLFAQMISSIPI